MDTSHWKGSVPFQGYSCESSWEEFAPQCVVYNNIRFLYAIKCSFGHDVSSKAPIFEIFIFAGLGVVSTSGASGEFIGVGPSGRLPLEVSFRISSASCFQLSTGISGGGFGFTVLVITSIEAFMGLGSLPSFLISFAGT